MRVHNTAIAFIVLLALSFTACSGSSSSISGNDNKAQVTVWVDASRLDAIKLYQKTHPDKAGLVKAEVVDRNQFPGKVLLFNNIQSGWPDVVFAEPSLVAQVSDKAHNYPQDLTPYVSKDILGNFAKGSNDSCTIEGKLVCLRNDLAQYVLYYNKPLMDQFGYKVPTTWEDYQALGLQVATDHPGYIIGAAGDNFARYAFFDGSHCPSGVPLANSKVLINVASDPRCTRAATLMDTLVGAKVLAQAGYFDGAMFQSAADNKLLMLPGPSWFAAFILKGSYYKTANKQIGVAAPPKWQADAQTFTGSGGGAAWAMSQHAKNKNLAADLILWLATSNDNQATSGTYPAYGPAAEAWHKTVQNDTIYAADPFDAFKAAANLVIPEYGTVRFDIDNQYNITVLKGVNDKKTFASGLADWQKGLNNAAIAAGYDVTTSQP